VSFPDGTSYYSLLAGGTAGARRLGLTGAYDFWGNSFRRGIEWLNGVAPPASALLVPVGEHVPAMTHGIWLREDIDLVLGDRLPSTEGAGEVYVLELARPAGHPEDRRPWLTRALEVKPPDFEVDCGGAPLLRGHCLGPRRAACLFLEEAKRTYEVEARGRLERALERAREDPNDLQALIAAYSLLRDLQGAREIEAFFGEIVPRIEDAVLRERVLRWLVEERRKDAERRSRGEGREGEPQ
ncbi:MAG: hypothetical protein AB1486_20095, partial [Planctomycetota bacterium]